MALVTAPQALSQPITDHEDGDGWRAGYWNNNYEPNVPGLDTDGDGSVDVPYDTDASKMWQNANQEGANANNDKAPQDRIYFDVMPVHSSAPSSPWPQTAEDNPRQQVLQYTHAELGFWRDCNGDGYVGSAITGTDAYSIDQLREEAAMNDDHDWENTCPVADRGPDSDVEDHVNLMYNDGIQVRELVPIGYQDRDAESGSETQDRADEELLCPDKTSGPSGENSERGYQRSGTNRTAEDDGILDDGEGSNVACYHAGTDFAVQDDYVKVGWHLEAPHEGESGTSSIVPPPDGITTDSNGFFWYLDNQNLGKVSETFPGLWPTTYNHEADDGYQDDSEYQDDEWDPRNPNQCDQHRDPTAPGDGATGTEAGDNVEQFAAENSDPTAYPDRAENWATDFSDLRKSRDTKLVTCSPVPNMQYIDVDNSDETKIDRFAWPLHIAEDRYSNEEKGENEPTPVTDPFRCKEDGQPGGFQDSGVNDDPSSWDGEDDADPVASSDQPHKYYGPNHDGPSVFPVVDRASSVLAAHAPGESCDGRADGDNLETYGAGGAEPGGPRDEMGDEMNYDSGECINPAKSPGIDQADTPVCQNLFGQSYDGQSGERAYDYSYWWGQGYIDVPNEPPDFYAGRTFENAGYADVSFGNVVEDDAGNCQTGYNFDPAGDDPYASGSSNCFPQASDPLADQVGGWEGDGHAGDEQPDDDNRGGVFDAGPFNPTRRPSVDSWDDYLPSSNDAHTFGNLHCEGFTALDTARGGSDAFGSATSDNQLGEFDCDRQDWMDTETIDCNLNGDQGGTNVSRINPNTEQSCYLNWKPGDRYDLWDVTCMDNSFRDPVGDTVQENIGNADCDTGRQPS
jgi:Zn ribbon nucleic-acid-binding protein